MEINCAICFQLLPQQAPNNEDQVDEQPSIKIYNLYLSKLFNFSFDSLFGNDTTTPLSNSFCSNCLNNIFEITQLMKKLDQLEQEVKVLKGHFEKNLIFGYEKSLGQSDGQQSDRYFETRAQLIEGLGHKIIKEQVFEEDTLSAGSPDFFDFDQNNHQQNQPDEPEGVEPIDKVLIISLQKLNLPQGQTSFQISELLKNKFISVKKLKPKSKTNYKRKKNDMIQVNLIFCSYDQCSFKTRHQTTLDNHVNRIHLKSYKCQICNDFSSSRRREVERHERKEHPESVRQFTCEQCGHRSLSAYELMNHRSSHDESSKIYKCETCFKGFPTISRLNTHLKTHQEFSCPCPVCGKSVWKNEIVFKIHVKTHEENLKCSTCKAIFKTITGFRYHILRCEKIFKFKCSQCPKEYVTRNELNTHVKRSHEFATPYVCNFCQKPYKYKDYLNVHIRTVHTGEKPYQCTLCEKSYASRHSFKIHKLTHNKNPEGLTHFCNFCGKKFLSYGYLQQHLTKTSKLCQAKEKERIASLIVVN